MIENLIYPQLLTKFRSFSRTLTFINVFTRIHHLSLLPASWTKLTISHIFPWFILILLIYSNLYAGLLVCLFPSEIYTKPQKAFTFAPMYATSLVDLIILMWLFQQYLLRRNPDQTEVRLFFMQELLNSKWVGGTSPDCSVDYQRLCLLAYDAV